MAAAKYGGFKENMLDENRYLYKPGVASKKPQMLPQQASMTYRLYIVLKRKLEELLRRILRPLWPYVGNWRFLTRLFSVLREHAESILRSARSRSVDEAQPLPVTAEHGKGFLPDSGIASQLHVEHASGCGDTMQSAAAVAGHGAAMSHLQGLVPRCATWREGLRTRSAGRRSRLARGALLLLRAFAFGANIAQGRFPESVRLAIARQTNLCGVWPTLLAGISRLIDTGRALLSSNLRATHDAGRFHLHRWRRGDFSHEQRLWSRALAASPSRQDVMDACSDVLKDEDVDDLAFWFFDAQATAVIVALFIVFACVAEVLSSSLYLQPVPTAVLSGDQLMSAASLSTSVISALPQEVTKA